MQRKPVITGGAVAAEWIGAAEHPFAAGAFPAGALPEGGLPERLVAEPPLTERAHLTGAAIGRTPTDASAPDARGKSVWRTGLRLLRDAAIGLAFISSLPLLLIAARGDVLFHNLGNVGARLQQVERVRTLQLPATSALSPTAAGALWHDILAVSDADALGTQPTRELAQRGWKDAVLTADMFPDIRHPNDELVRSTEILQRAHDGLSPNELQYLRLIAESPLWEQIDRVATAEAVDVIGARYVLPFAPDASPMLLKTARFAESREIAYAGLARAAYYVAIDEPERAEHALRAVLSFGFVMIDNGTSAVEALIGRVVIGVANNGLHTLYTITGNEQGAALTTPMTNEAPARSAQDSRSPEMQLRALASDPSASHAMRWESLRVLGYSSCSNVSEVLFGPSAQTTAAFSDARTSLARYPSDRALLDLLEDGSNRPLAMEYYETPFDVALIGAASVASTVLNSPRVLACTKLLTAYD